MSPHKLTAQDSQADLSPSGDELPISKILQRVAATLPSAVTKAHESPILPSKEQIKSAALSFSHPLKDEGLGFENTLDTLTTQLAPGFNLNSLNPRYYGFVTGGVVPAAMAADFITTIYDQNVSVHLPNETIATNVEVDALNLLLDLLHLDRASFPCKTFTTGATASNIQGLALGREWLIRTYAKKNGVNPAPSVGDLGLLQASSEAGITRVEVLSTFAHSSIAKAASIVGLGRSSLVEISGEIDPVSLRLSALEEYVKSRKPTTATILVLSVGEVNTGQFATSGVEFMQTLRAFCTKHNIWIHADGAFGLFARLLIPSPTEQTNTASEFSYLASCTLGLELADSITGDGHKLLNVPYDCGFFFSRHSDLATDVFQNGNAAYLKAPASDDGGEKILSPLNIGIENSRRFRALPVYAALLSLGRNGYTDIIKTLIRLARKITAYLLDHPDYIVLPDGPVLEKLATSPDQRQEQVTKILDRTFMIVLFRARDPAINDTLTQRIKDTGDMYVSGTSWNGEPAVRIAISNWKCDVERDFEIVKDVLERVLI